MVKKIQMNTLQRERKLKKIAISYSEAHTNHKQVTNTIRANTIKTSY